MRRITIALIAALAAIAVPAAASAHVSLHPNEVPTGAFATLDLRVPNESDKANTVKVAVQVPPGFTDVSPEFMPGWTPVIRTVKLAKPVQTDDGPITEGVREIVWEGKGPDGKIPPGQFLNFPISTEIPGKAGDTLTFKVLQYYDDGEVARWIGPPNSEEPAPTSTSPRPAGRCRMSPGPRPTRRRRARRRGRRPNRPLKARRVERNRIVERWLRRQGPRDRGARRRGDLAGGRRLRGLRVSPDGRRDARAVEDPLACRAAPAYGSARVEAHRPDAHTGFGDERHGVAPWRSCVASS